MERGNVMIWLTWGFLAVLTVAVIVLEVRRYWRRVRPASHVLHEADARRNGRPLGNVDVGEHPLNPTRLPL